MTLHDYQVLQRNQDGKARVTLSDGSVKELETGGPYEIDGAREVYVGDLWILAGQSNMEGCGDLVDLEEPAPYVHLFGIEEAWSIAQEPLHWLSDSPRNIHFKLWGLSGAPAVRPPHDPNRTKGSGLGLTFAKAYYAATGVPVGLISSAHGGTSMTQWNPDLKGEGGDSLYGATYERFKLVGGKVAGILWYQGESDTGTPDYPLFTERFHKLIQAFRSDLGQPDLPFYYVQLGRFTIPDQKESVDGWNAAREAQRLFVGTLPNTDVVAAIDLGLDDGIHIGTPGLKKLGERLARVATGNSAPALESITLESNPQRLRVSFNNVDGALTSQGRPSGFSFRDADGNEPHRPYKIVLDGNSVLLYFDTNPIPAGVSVFYGWGLDPYCNIIDGSGMPIPAFGPVPFPTE